MCSASLSQVGHLWDSITVPAEQDGTLSLEQPRGARWSLDSCRQELCLHPREFQFLYLLNEDEHKGILLVWHWLSH